MKAAMLFFMFAIVCLVASIMAGPAHSEEQGWGLALMFLGVNLGMIVYMCWGRKGP